MDLAIVGVGHHDVVAGKVVHKVVEMVEVAVDHTVVVLD